jgi:hypothetical protein
MRVKSLSSLCLVMAILFVIAVASEIFIEDHMKPSSLFGYLIITTMFSGVLSSVIVEKIDAKILE